MKKTVVVLIFTLVLLFSVVFAASAITDGELDGDGHPFVGLALFYDESGEYMWRCSGTLLSDTVFLTAGHCTYSTHMARVYFGADLMNLEYPYDFDGCGPYTCYEGDTYVHPEYDDNAFYVHDAGIVVLDQAVAGISTFGTLPEIDQLDALMPSRGVKASFTAVGYGLQASFPEAADWKTVADRIRMVAYPELLQLNAPGMTGDYSMLLSNNPNTGGTCYGDSGGPNFLGKGDEETNVVAGVTSFGMNVSCAGTGGVFRMDRENVLDFVEPFLED